MTSSSQRGRRKKGDSGEPATEQSRAGTPRRELVENEIYEHATRLFAERGFAGTSLQDIASAVGLLKGSIYYYIKTKEDLLYELVNRAQILYLGTLEEDAELTVAPAPHFFPLPRFEAGEGGERREATVAG